MTFLQVILITACFSAYCLKEPSCPLKKESNQHLMDRLEPRQSSNQEAYDSLIIRARIGHLYKDTASTSEIISSKGLTLQKSNYPPDYFISIIQFDIAVYDRDSNLVAYNLPESGHLFSKNHIGQIRSVNGKGKIYFESVLFKEPSGTVRRLKGFTIEIRG